MTTREPCSKNEPWTGGVSSLSLRSVPSTNSLRQASENTHPAAEGEGDTGWNMSRGLKFRARPLNAAAERSQLLSIGYGR